MFYQIAQKGNNKENESVKLKDLKKIIKTAMHYNIHLYHHLCTKDRKNETEPSNQASKVSGVMNKGRAHTESKDDANTTVEIAAVSDIKDLKKKVAKNQYFEENSKDKEHFVNKAKTQNIVFNQLEDSKENDEQNTISDEDLYDPEVIETIVNLGYPIEEVIRLIEEEDEEMISLYLRLLHENQNHMKAIYPSYMRSKVSDWKNYAFLLASPENSSSRSRREKSRNNRVLSYSPKRNKHYIHKEKGSGKEKQLRFAFYPKDTSSDEGKPHSRNRKLLGGRQFSPN